MGDIVVKTRKRVVPAAMLATVPGSALAFEDDQSPCYEAYRQSALTHLQMSFENFSRMYAQKVCAPGGDGALVGNAPRAAASRSVKRAPDVAEHGWRPHRKEAQL